MNVIFIYIIPHLTSTDSFPPQKFAFPICNNCWRKELRDMAEAYNWWETGGGGGAASSKNEGYEMFRRSIFVAQTLGPSLQVVKYKMVGQSSCYNFHLTCGCLVLWMAGRKAIPAGGTTTINNKQKHRVLEVIQNTREYTFRRICVKFR
jgi:hypothetical protein